MKEFRKFTVAVVGVAADCLAAGALHGTAQQAAMLLVSVGTALGVYRVRNGDKPTPPTTIL